MLKIGKQKIPEIEKVNEAIAKIEGFLTEKEAGMELVKFLRSNIYVAAFWLSGVKLFPYQEICIKSMLKRDYSLLVMGRGVGKTFMSAVFAILQCVLYPGTRLAIVSRSFRQSRLIFQEIERIIAKPEAQILVDSMPGKPRHVQDEWKMEFGTSEIYALPLGDGQKLRGFRLNCMLIDEFLLMPEKIVNEVLTPFMAVASEPVKRQEYSDQLDKLVKQGAITKEEADKRFKLAFRNPKLIAMSSASYEFEYLYKLYCLYIARIENGTEDGFPLRSDESNILKSSYCVFQFSYEVPPPKYLSSSIVEKARSEMSVAQFKREYCGQFTGDSSGYFSAKAMELCSVPAGSMPVFEIVGDKSSKYLVAIDPSFSENETSDFFAISVFKILEEKKIMLVHCYAVAGGKLRDHISYFRYILLNFNVKFIIMDNAGGVQFLSSCNESQTFKSSNLYLEKIEGCDFSKTEGYEEELKNGRRLYSEERKRIVYMQFFSSEWIRRSNEYLQSAIDNKRIKFAGDACSVEGMMDSLMQIQIGIENLNFLGEKDESGESYNENDLGTKQLDLLERQNFLIKLTKTQCALIEVKTSETGIQSFGLPQELKGNRGKDKARKDLYTALLLGCWGGKVYRDLMTVEKEEFNFFVPQFLN